MVRTILSALILFAVIWFAVSNAASVRLNVFFWNISVSVAVVVFATFVVGFIFGVLRVAPSWFRQNLQAGKHKKELEQCATESQERAQRIKELELELTTERKKDSLNGDDE